MFPYEFLCKFRHTCKYSESPEVFGKDATCIGQLGDFVTLEIQKVCWIHGISVPQPVKKHECTRAEVVEVLEGAKTMLKLGRMTSAERGFIIKACCGSDTGFAVHGEPGRMLADTDLVIISEYLQWQYMQPEVIMMGGPGVKCAIHFGTEPGEGALALQEIMDAMQVKRYVILPVHCDAPLHWTVLVLHVEKDSCRLLGVQYYDWCSGMVESRALAQKLLGLITLRPEVADQPMKLPLRSNAFHQKTGSNDCGFAVWQAYENACKPSRGEILLESCQNRWPGGGY